MVDVTRGMLNKPKIFCGKFPARLVPRITIDHHMTLARPTSPGQQSPAWRLRAVVGGIAIGELYGGAMGCCPPDNDHMLAGLCASRDWDRGHESQQSGEGGLQTAFSKQEHLYKGCRQSNFV